MSERFQLFTLKSSVSFPPGFLHSLAYHYREYQNTVENLKKLIIFFEDFLFKIFDLQKDVIRDVSVFEGFNGLNPLVQPLMSDLLFKVQNFFTLHNDGNSSLERILINSTYNLVEQFIDYVKIIPLKILFEDSLKKYFALMKQKSENSEAYENCFTNLRKNSLKFSYELSKRIKRLDKEVYSSIFNFTNEIKGMSFQFNNANLQDFDSMGISLNFIIKNNEITFSQESKEISALYLDLNLGTFSEDITEDVFKKPLIEELRTKMLKFEIERPSSKTSFCSIFKRKEVSELFKINFQSFDSYFSSYVPSFIDCFKYGEEKSQSTSKSDELEISGYLDLIFLGPNETNPNKSYLLYISLDSINGFLLGQGLLDSTPIPLVYLCHCLLIDDNLKLTSFEISSHNRHIVIEAYSEKYKDLWMKAIQKGIDSSLDNIQYKIKDYHIGMKESTKIYKNVSEVIYSVDGNNICADCNAKNPEWMNYHQGVTLCSECAGAHRSFGTHNNHVRSLLHDYWNDKNFNHIISMGNTKINSILEKKLDPSQKPTVDSTPKERKDFTKKKYHDKEFVQ